MTTVEEVMQHLGEVMKRLETTRAKGGKPCGRCGRDMAKDPQVFGWVATHEVVCSGCAAVLPKGQILRAVCGEKLPPSGALRSKP